MERRRFDLGWMRVFVEAARLGSLSAAATSLRLTQPAVSYQIRRAEEEAGFAVFRRQHKGVELTAKGRRLFEIVEKAVAEIDALVREQHMASDHPSIRLRTDYAVSSLWLIPRLHAFRRLHPETDIQIIATQRFRQEEMEENDVAIAFGELGEFGPAAILLLPEEVVPVCTQAYLDRNAQSANAENLGKARLIHLDAFDPAPWFDWMRYFAELGMPRDAANQQGDMRFNTYSLVIQAVMEDQGVALGWMGLIDGLLRSRVLVPAGPAFGAPNRGYWLVPPQAPNLHSERLTRWLETETRNG